jgi:hypothetical protein
MVVANVRVSLRVENTKSAFSVDAALMVLVVTTYSGHDEVPFWPRAPSARLANRSAKLNIKASQWSSLVSEVLVCTVVRNEAGCEELLILHASRLSMVAPLQDRFSVDDVVSAVQPSVQIESHHPPPIDYRQCSC